MNCFLPIVSIVTVLLSVNATSLSRVATEGLTSEELVERGIGLINIGDFGLGVEYLDRAIEEYPTSGEGYTAKLLIYYVAGDLEEAFKTAEAYIAACPTDSEAWELKAMLAEDCLVRDYDQLKDAADGIYRLNPESPLAIYYTGRVAFERDQFDEAIEWLENIEQEDPRVIADTERTGRQIYEEAMKYKGIAQFALKDYGNAIQTFEKLISIYPASFYYSYLYLTSALNGNRDREIIKRGLRESPDEAFRYILEFYNDDTESETIMDLAEDPETETCLGFFIGMGYKVVGDEKKAKEYFKKAVNSGFTNAFEYRQAKRELEKLEGKR